MAINTLNKLSLERFKVWQPTIRSIGVLVRELNVIKSDFTSLNANLTALAKIDIDQFSALKTKFGIMNQPVMGLFKAGIGRRYGDMTQIYAAAKNNQLVEEINHVNTYIDSLSVWLNKVSKITDSNQIKQYFGLGNTDENLSVSGFFKNLNDLGQKIDQINAICGEAIKKDKLIVSSGVRLEGAMNKTTEIVTLFEKSDAEVKNLDLFKYFERTVLDFIKVIFEEDKSFVDQDRLLNNIKFFVEYVLENYFKAKKYSDNVSDDFKFLKTGFDKILLFKKYFDSVKDVSKEFDVNNHKKALNLTLESSGVKELVTSVVAIEGAGDEKLRTFYINQLQNYVKTLEEFSDLDKQKLSFFNQAVIRQVLTVTLAENDITIYQQIITKLFDNFTKSNIKSLQEAENFVINIRTSIIGSTEQH